MAMGILADTYNRKMLRPPNTREPITARPGFQAAKITKMCIRDRLKLRSVPTDHPFVEGAVPHTVGKRSAEEPRLHIRLETLHQLSPALLEAERIVLPIGELEQDPSLIQVLGSRLVCELPALVFPPEEEGLRERLVRLREQGLQAVCVHNLGTLHLDVYKRQGQWRQFDSDIPSNPPCRSLL